jgi:hypothetical protein
LIFFQKQSKIINRLKLGKNMAITDINISEQLETGAPSIKYEGDQGPQDPRKEQALALLKEEYMQYVFEQRDMDEPVMSFEEWYQSVYQASKMGVQAPQEQITTEETMMRESAAFGGIMDRHGRRRYGIGRIVRKAIPKEIAKVAEVAAPFVAMAAPQFALPAALAGGLGSYKRSGNLMGALKSGAMTYGLGALSPGLPGVRDMGPQSGMFTTQPFGGQYNISNLFKESAPISDLPTSGNTLGKSAPILEDIDMAYKAGDFDLAKAGSKVAKENLSLIENIKEYGPIKGVLKNINEAGMSTKALMGIVGVSGLAGLMTAMEQPEEELETLDRGVGLPGGISAIRTEVIEAMKDPSGEKLKALRIKYPFLGAQETKNVGIMAEGGRAGYYSGGQSIPSEYTVEDARKTAIQDKLGGITDSMKQADLLRKGDIGQMYAAQGGRIEAQEGGLMDLGGMEKDYRNTGGFVDLGAKEKADDVPARLSVNEFVMTADAVRGAGGGDIDKGAEIMENVMKNLEKGGRISEESQGLQGAQEMFEVSERLSEVV